MTNFTVHATSNGVELAPLTFSLDVVMTEADWKQHNDKFTALVQQMTTANVVEVVEAEEEAPVEETNIEETDEAPEAVELVEAA